MTTVPSSTCDQAFTHTDFQAGAPAIPGSPSKCPVHGCKTTLCTVPYRKSVLPYCVDHGLRLHQGTFVYYNGSSKKDGRRARLRNFAFEPDFVADHVLDSTKKAETHRLGYEMSEDALSWNVFVGLMLGGKLREATAWLIGRPVTAEPDLYLWGSRVNLAGKASDPYPPLLQVRKNLEPTILRFPTEPDIMLVVPGKLVVCVEAKFGSGNPMAHSAVQKPGEKPKTVQELLSRYLGIPGSWTGESHHIRRDRISEKLHSQLFRNVVFAARMAELEGNSAEWHVVNLVSATQWKGRQGSEEYSFREPSELMRSFLANSRDSWFTFKKWEDIYTHLVKDDPKLASLRTFMEGKSAHYVPAFDWEPAT